MLGLDTGAVERALEARLGVSALLRACTGAAPGLRLSRTEGRRVPGLGSEIRTREWLRGRAALEAVLAGLGEAADPFRLRFPHPRLSLAHSAEAAVAVGLRDPDRCGVGIDLELDRLPDPRTARLFLTDSERGRWQRGHAAGDGSDLLRLLRLWTVKESLFKADPENAGCWLADYELLDGERTEADRGFGRARMWRGESPLELEYAWFRLERGFLAISVSETTGERTC